MARIFSQRGKDSCQMRHAFSLLTRRPALRPTTSTSLHHESTEPAVEDGEEETEDVDDPEERPSPRRNEPRNTDSRERICPLYAKNQCPHGASGKVKVDGETCPNPHPRKCMKFCRYGNKRGRGCEKGRSCSHYHPILCKFSVRNGECRKRECTFTHMRHTKRPPQQRDTEGHSNQGERRFNEGSRASPQFDRDSPPPPPPPLTTSSTTTTRKQCISCKLPK